MYVCRYVCVCVCIYIYIYIYIYIALLLCRSAREVDNSTEQSNMIWYDIVSYAIIYDDRLYYKLMYYDSCLYTVTYTIMQSSTYGTIAWSIHWLIAWQSRLVDRSKERTPAKELCAFGGRCCVAGASKHSRPKPRDLIWYFQTGIWIAPFRNAIRKTDSISPPPPPRGGDV